MRTRPYVVVPSVKHQRYKTTTHSYPNNAFLEAQRIVQETGQAVTVYRREGKSRIPITIVNPQDQLALLLGRKRRLEAELVRLEEEIAALGQYAGDQTQERD